MGEKTTFTIISGNEKYRIVDLDTGGEAFFDEKLDAYKHMAIIHITLGHNYRLEIRDFPLPYDYRDSETRERDEHWQQYRDGDLNDCTCSLCQFWNEQEAQDREKV